MNDTPARPCAFVLYARVPRRGAVKTRMVPHLDLDQALALHVALIEDSLDLLREAAAHAGSCPVLALSEAWTPGADDPAGALTRAIGDITLLPQRGGDLGDRMRHTCDDLFARGHRGVVFIGSDSPTLPAARLVAAQAAIERGVDVVVGPCEDGGYYLIGLSRRLPDLFTGIAWGGGTVFADTVDAARRLGVRTEILPPWYDIDRPADLARLQREGRDARRGAARTIAFAAALARGGRPGI